MNTVEKPTTIEKSSSMKQEDINELSLLLMHHEKVLQNLILTTKKAHAGDGNPDATIKNLLTKLQLQLQIIQGYTRKFKHLHHENTSFLTILKNDYPQISIMEIELCIMIRLGLQTKEIAELRNVSSDAIKKSRYRLRKKFDIPTSETLIGFLQDLDK